MPLPEFPNVKSGGTTNAVLSNHASIVGFSSSPSPMRLGRWPSRAGIRHVARHTRREGKAAAVVHDALRLPPANETICERSCAAEESLSSAERQLGAKAHRQKMRSVESGRPRVVGEVAADTWRGHASSGSATTYAKRGTSSRPTTASEIWSAARDIRSTVPGCECSCCRSADTVCGPECCPPRGQEC